MNADDIKDNNYIQITSTENKFYIRHCTKLFHKSFFSHLILKLTFEVTISPEL